MKSASALSLAVLSQAIELIYDDSFLDFGDLNHIKYYPLTKVVDGRSFVLKSDYCGKTVFSGAFRDYPEYWFASSDSEGVVTLKSGVNC